MALTRMTPSFPRPQKRRRAEFEDLDHSFHTVYNKLRYCDYQQQKPTLPHISNILAGDANLDDCELTPVQPSPLLLPAPLPLLLPSAELTTENLLSHTQSLDPSTSIIMPPASSASTPSGTTRVKSAAHHEKELLQFGAEVDSSEPFPADLQSHIDNVIKAPRPNSQSPNAKWLSMIAKVQEGSTEATVAHEIAPLLLFKGRLSPPFDGEHSIRLDFNVVFEKKYMKNGNCALPAAIPDVCVGYIRNKHAQNSTTALFSQEEENVLMQFGISTTGETVLPFITAQIKTVMANYLIGRYQGARDGIAVAQAIEDLFSAAGLITSALDTQHWSLTCDGKTATLYVHWVGKQTNGTKRFYMREVFEAHLVNDQKLWTLRSYLRNILDYSRQQRVSRIKEAVRKFLKHKPDSGYGSTHNATPPQQSQAAHFAQGMSTATQQWLPTPPRQHLSTPSSGKGFWTVIGQADQSYELSSPPAPQTSYRVPPVQEGPPMTPPRRAGPSPDDTPTNPRKKPRETPSHYRP